MVEEDFNLNDASDNESELYALIHTILNAYKKFQEGTINDNFFRKTVKNTIKELLKFNFYLKEKEIDLPSLLKKMNFTEKYNEAIRVINNISSLDHSNSINGEDTQGEVSPSKEINPSITCKLICRPSLLRASETNSEKTIFSFSEADTARDVGI